MSSAARQGQEGPPMSAYVPALAQFVVSSVGMVVGNKMAVAALPLPGVLMLIQIIGTVVLLAASGSASGISLKQARQWLPIATLFTLMIFTSASTFLHASVSSVLIFRNLAAIFTTVAEYGFLGVTTSAEVLMSEVLIVAGATVYGWGSVTFTWTGFAWMLSNVVCQVAYGIYLKREMIRNPAVDKMSKFTMSLYNNVLAVPIISVFIIVWGEHTKLGVLADVDFVGWSLVALTCGLGFMISTSGFGLQKLVSATSFIVANNLAKFLNIAFGMLFLNDKLAGTTDWIGCFFAFAGGFWYSFASARHRAQSRRKAETPPPAQKR